MHFVQVFCLFILSRHFMSSQWGSVIFFNDEDGRQGGHRLEGKEKYIHTDKGKYVHFNIALILNWKK